MELITSLTIGDATKGSLTRAEIHRIESQMELYQKATQCQSEWADARGDLFRTHVEPKLNLLSEQEGVQLLVDHLGEDLQWNWLNKALNTLSADYDWFTLECDSKVQGVLVAYHPKKSLTESGDVFYIDYLATAPWNRDTPSTSALFKGIGTSLVVSVAIYYIKRQSYKPGFLLHSLPAAEGYYRGLGMTDLGIDASKENLRQFEMNQANCLGLLERRKAS